MPELPIDLSELVRRALEDRLTDVHTSAPGTVVKFDSAAYTVDVRLGFKRSAKAWDDSVTYEELPILPAVPVACFGTSRAYVKSDLQVGDKVWLIFSEQSPSEFLEGAEVAEPGDTARHSLSGALAIPFVLPAQLGSTTVVLGGSGASYVALASLVEGRFSALVSAIQTMATTGNSGGPLTFTPPAASSVAATQTKAL